MTALSDALGSDLAGLLLVVFLAALVTDLATGLGALPFFFFQRVSGRLNGWLLGGAAGMMAVASLLQLLGEAMERAPGPEIWQPAFGLAAGAAFFALAGRWLEDDRFDLGNLRATGGPGALLIVAAMTLHSMPEGVAIGVAYGSGEAGFGPGIAAALAVHNVPEGVAIAAALRGKGASALACLGWAVFSSIPQPLFAPPAAALVWLFEPLLPVGLGFAAGAMLYLVTSELIPEANQKAGRTGASVAFAGGCVLMLVLARGVELVSG